MMNATTADGRFAEVAGAFADRTRARMLTSLLDGRERTATDLASFGQVAASTASSHLARLEASGLIVCLPRGKHRYYRLAGELVAAAVESLFRLSGEPHPPAIRVPNRLRQARTCYDHAAGELGVALHDRLRELQWIVPDGVAYEVTALGAEAFQDWRIDCEALRVHRRAFARPCLDWSERRAHVAGALGAAILGRMLAVQWVERELDSRALTITTRGVQELSALGVRLGATPARSRRARQLVDPQAQAQSQSAT
jgi:DNA-binding transcriptional ArsR family regulator